MKVAFKVTRRELDIIRSLCDNDFYRTSASERKQKFNLSIWDDVNAYIIRRHLATLRKTKNEFTFQLKYHELWLLDNIFREIDFGGADEFTQLEINIIIGKFDKALNQ